MRFVGPDGETSATTRTPPQRALTDENSFDTITVLPERKPLTDENSFEARVVSPTQVLRAQNLVSAEILSEKLLHPPQGTGTGVDEVSHAAVVEDEGSVRRIGATGVGNRSLGEKSFEVFVDEEDGNEEGLDVLPIELTRPTKAGQWSSAGERHVAEKRTATATRTKEVAQSEDQNEASRKEEPEFIEDGLQATEPTAPKSVDSNEESEGEEYEESGVLAQPTERQYYEIDRHEFEAEGSGSDRVDYDQPEIYADDDELSGEDYGAEDDLHHAGYYSQTRAGRHQEEEYYISEEEYSEEEEEEEEEDLRPKAPQVVDLTLDSSDEEEDEAMPEPSDQDEEMLHSDEEGEEEHQEQDRDRDTSSWRGIESSTPFANLSRLTSHHQSGHVLDSLLDQSTQPHPNTFHQPPAAQGHIGDMLDPAMFQHPSAFQRMMGDQFVDPGTASLLDEVLDFQVDQATLLYPPQPKQQMQEMQTEQREVETIGQGVDMIDRIAELEFLTGLLPMGDMEKYTSGVERERSESPEFLPNIVPEMSTGKLHEAALVPVTATESAQLAGQMNTEVGKPSQPEGSIVTTQPTVLPDDIIRPAEPTQSTVPTEPTEPIDLSDSTTQFTFTEPIAAAKDSQKTPSFQTKSSEQEATTEQPQPITIVPTPDIPRVPQRFPSPSPFPPTWSTDGLLTPLSYFPPLSTITPPSLRAQKSGSKVDVIGIIRTTSPINKTNGPDFVLPLHIVDPSTGPDSGLSVMLFRPHKSALPNHASVGAVLLATNMKVQSHAHRAQIRTGDDSGWAVFPSEGSGEVGDTGPPVEFGEEERGMVKQLQRWWRRSVEKEREVVVNDEGESANKVNGNAEQELNGNVGGHVKPRMKYKARRGGKVVNLNPRG